MTALPEAPESRPDCTAVVDEFVRRLPGLQVESLRVALQVLQARLGTPAEQPCDIERAQALGHEIRNRLTVNQLRMGLRQFDRRSGQPSS